MKFDIKEFLAKLFQPEFWMQNHPTSAEWDRELNDMLDNHSVVIKSNFVCEIDGVEIWIQNYPYAFGSPQALSHYRRVLPKIATRKRLLAAVGEASERGYGVDIAKIRSLRRSANRIRLVEDSK